jgi:L-alanine-DL-glutamate epimerase-like enolase superfamily enzyme
MHLHLHDVHLALRQPFTTAHGTLTSQHNLIVVLSDGTHYGLGESPFSHAWPHLSPTTARQALEAAAPLISTASPDHPAQLWHLVQPALAHQAIPSHISPKLYSSAGQLDDAAQRLQHTSVSERPICH